MTAADPLDRGGWQRLTPEEYEERCRRMSEGQRRRHEGLPPLRKPTLSPEERKRRRLEGYLRYRARRAAEKRRLEELEGSPRPKSETTIGVDSRPARRAPADVPLPPPSAARFVPGTTPAARAKARTVLALALDFAEQQLAAQIERGEAAIAVATAAVALLHADNKSPEYGRAMNALYAAARAYEQRTLAGVGR